MELIDKTSSDKIRDLIDSAKHIAIIPSKVAGPDAFAAAAALYHMLLSKEKPVSLIYTGKYPEICEGLVTRDQITSDIFQRELWINIDYTGTSAGKVHYFTEDDSLTLKLSPVGKDFDLSRVKASLVGLDFDLVFAIGVNEYHDLGQTYSALEQEIHSAKVINIDNTSKNTNFGLVNVIDPLVDTLSMMVYLQAPTWGLLPNTKSAKAILTGISYKDLSLDSQPKN